MAAARRIGAQDSKTRAQLLDAAERLMLDEGYAAVTSRRVASQAGLKPQLVHYYFRTMGDLFLEVFRRRADESLERFSQAMAENRSLRTLWEYSSQPPGAAFTIEFVVLANHRKEIRAEIARYAERFRTMQLDTIEAVLADHGLPADAYPPIVILLALTGLTQVLALEDMLGVSAGHAETIAFIEGAIDQLEGSLRAAAKGPESQPRLPRRR